MAQSSQHRTAFVLSHLARRPMRHRIRHQVMFNCHPPRGEGVASPNLSACYPARAHSCARPMALYHMKNYRNREVRGLRRALYFKNVRWLTYLPCTDGFRLRKYMLLFEWCVFVVVQNLVRAARAKLVWLPKQGLVICASPQAIASYSNEFQPRRLIRERAGSYR